MAEEIARVASAEHLRRLEAGTTTAAALDFFDTLPPLDPSELVGLGTAGSWRGSGVPTRHPLDGALERLGWYGKRFDTEDDVHPLVFRAREDRLVCVDPRFLPLGLALRIGRLLRTAAAARAFALVRPLLTTTTPQARLRTVEYRGAASAAMVYDRQPIIDAFRRVDESTVLGVMDLRGMRAPYVFILRREEPGR